MRNQSFIILLKASCDAKYKISLDFIFHEFITTIFYNLIVHIAGTLKIFKSTISAYLK